MLEPIVCLDTETATWSGAPHLLELGAVRIEDGEVTEHFQSLVRPPVEIDPRASEVHGLEERDVLAAPLAAELLESFSEWLGDCWPVAHNAPFDARVLAFEYARAGLESPAAPWICSLRLSRKLLPEAPDHKLDSLAEHLGLESGEHHRALPDAVWCWKVVEACLDREPQLERAAALLARQGGQPITLAGEAPRPGRALKPRHRALIRALGKGEPVTLIYGTPPAQPVPLSVVPQLLYNQSDKSYLEAECGQSGLIKTYRLDRIHQVRD